MSDHKLLSSFAASSLIHLILVVPVVSLMVRAQVRKLQLVPVQLVDVPLVEETRKADLTPPQPQANKPKAQKITAPKLLSKPDIFDTPLFPTIGNIKKETKELEEPVEKLPPLASPAPPGWKPGSTPGAAEGSAAGGGNLFGKGDAEVIGGSGLEVGGGGQGASGLGRVKGEGVGGSSGVSGEALSGLARPLGGYQVKPRYPESARRAGAQGITLLKLRVLANGKVGEVQIEQSAGHPDIDNAAVDAVKKWLFEPARMGKIAVAVWVLLPVKFELE